MISLDALRSPRGRVADISGQRFGRLIALRCVGVAKESAAWECACDCGSTTVTYLKYLRTGATVSCGCKRQETMDAVGDIRRSHGASKTDIYSIWCQIVRRCENPEAHAYESYGGRGIYMCKRWREDFEAFRDDMGPRPSKKHTVDRIDNNGPYSPENCRWATPAEQARNTRRFCGSCRIELQAPPLCEMTELQMAAEEQRIKARQRELQEKLTALRSERALRKEEAA